MLITLDPDESFHATVARDASEVGVHTEPVAVRSWDDLAVRLDGGLSPSAVLIGPGLNAEQATEVARGLKQRLPDVIVLLVAMPTTTTLRAALRAGISDVLSPAYSRDDLADALRNAGYSEEGRTDEKAGLTIAVYSSKGGVGTSVLASNLAHRLGDLTGVPTVLADLDLASADQAVLHGVRPTWTMQDLADGAVGDDLDALDQVLLPLPDSPVRLLAGPLDPAAAENIGERPVTDALHRLRRLAPLVVVDTASAFTDATLAVLERADVIVLVVSLDVLSLRSLTITLQTFERLGIDRSNVRVVAMRADAKVGLTVDDVARTTGARVDVAVPSSREVARSINVATPLARDNARSSVVRAIDDLARQLIDGVTIEGAREARGAQQPRFALRRRGAGSTGVPAPSSNSDGQHADELAESAEAAPPPAAPPPDVAPRRVRRTVTRRAASSSTREVVATPPAEPTEPDDVEEEAGHVAPVIDLADSGDRLASLPPPKVDGAPATPTSTTKGRRRNARS